MHKTHKTACRNSGGNDRVTPPLLPLESSQGFRLKCSSFFFLWGTEPTSIPHCLFPHQTGIGNKTDATNFIQSLSPY